MSLLGDDREQASSDSSGVATDISHYIEPQIPIVPEDLVVNNSTISQIVGRMSEGPVVE